MLAIRLSMLKDLSIGKRLVADPKIMASAKIMGAVPRFSSFCAKKQNPCTSDSSGFVEETIHISTLRGKWREGLWISSFSTVWLKEARSCETVKFAIGVIAKTHDGSKTGFD